jgi:hypothetical protein
MAPIALLLGDGPHKLAFLIKEDIQQFQLAKPQEAPTYLCFHVVTVAQLRLIKELMKHLGPCVFNFRPRHICIKL